MAPPFKNRSSHRRLLTLSLLCSVLVHSLGIAFVILWHPRQNRHHQKPTPQHRTPVVTYIPQQSLGIPYPTPPSTPGYRLKKAKTLPKMSSKTIKKSKKSSFFTHTSQLLQTVRRNYQTHLNHTTPRGSLVQERHNHMAQHQQKLKELSYQDRLKKHAYEAWHRFVAHNKNLYRSIHPHRPASFSFSINQSGNIHSFSLTSSSGSSRFDEIVQRFLYEEAAPFPPIPKHLNTTTFTPHLNCTFYLPT